MARKKTTRKKAKKKVETLTHDEASRKNIPTAEFQSVMAKEQQQPIRVTYERPTRQGDELQAEKEGRNRDLDPQLVWRGKDEQDWSDLVTHAPPLFIQEKVHPKVLIDDLLRRTHADDKAADPQMDLFADFNGLPDSDVKTEFYQHDANWTNRMILGDSLQVMASLAEREGLRGQVQCIYIDPPYGIKFNSNFQWSTTSRTVQDGRSEHITREPEQVKAFRDTWRDGIQSYLTHLRDRLTVARDLLHKSGSIFVQIGDENIHRVRAVMDEVFGEMNFVSQITVTKTAGASSETLAGITDFVLWYAKCRGSLKYRQLLIDKSTAGASGDYRFVVDETGQVYSGAEAQGIIGKAVALTATTSQRPPGSDPVIVKGSEFRPGRSQFWKTNVEGLERLDNAGRIHTRTNSLRYIRYLDDYPVVQLNNLWNDIRWGFDASQKRYVVETHPGFVTRCLLMATDPGDLVLDPTCGSGTTAYVAENWGRRWITIDTSRVALALARARVVGARFPYFLLADSLDGVRKEAEVTRADPPENIIELSFSEDVRQGFVYKRVPHITLKAIANNAEIDVIWDDMQPAVEQALANLNATLQSQEALFKITVGGRAGKTIDFAAPPGKTVKLASGEDAPGTALLEWEVPRRPETPWDTECATAHTICRTEFQRHPGDLSVKAKSSLKAINVALGRAYTRETLPERPADPWPADAVKHHTAFWEARIARQKEIDASITAKADFEYLYDAPYEDKEKVRVAGPFTVEGLSPHRTLHVDADDELIDPFNAPSRTVDCADFVSMILENLKTSGVQQAHKEDKITFSSIAPWPGHFIAAEGRYVEGEEGKANDKRAGIFIGPEFGTVSRQDLVAAAREAGDADFDVLIACAFNYEAHASEFSKLGRIPILKARMNADLHMADDLKNTGRGNLFVIFGEPDIDILGADDDQVQVKINGVDVFHPSSGEVRSDGADGIACWFIDTDYNEESFFVRHAYFLGANDPYKSLKTTLKAEINEDAWATLNSDISRPFPRPKGGRIAVKVINHLGDEVMKVFRVD